MTEAWTFVIAAYGLTVGVVSVLTLITVVVLRGLDIRESDMVRKPRGRHGEVRPPKR